MAAVEFSGVEKVYAKGDRPAVAGFDLTVADGEFLVLVGPSGCGKSTTLRMVAGLELPNFEVPVIHGTLEGDSQLALSGLAVARRGLWDDGTNDSILAGIALWERMTEGME